MNTAEEWHAVVIGWALIACPFSPKHGLMPEAEFKPYKEYHYYLFGRVCGFITLGLEIAGFLKLIEVIFS